MLVQGSPFLHGSIPPQYALWSHFRIRTCWRRTIEPFGITSPCSRSESSDAGSTICTIFAPTCKLSTKTVTCRRSWTSSSQMAGNPKQDTDAVYRQNKGTTMCKKPFTGVECRNMVKGRVQILHSLTKFAFVYTIITSATTPELSTQTGNTSTIRP